MKRMIQYILPLLLFLLCLPMAGAEDILDRSFEMIDGSSVENALGKDARELMGDTGIRTDFDFAQSIKMLFSRAGARVGEYIRYSLAGGLRIFGIAVICALAVSITDKMGKGIALAGTLAITAAAVGDVNSLLGLGRQTMLEFVTFGKVLMPVLTAASVAAGNVTASGAVYVAVMFVVDVLITLFADSMMPLIWAYIALIVAAGVTDNDGLAKLAKSLKNGITITLKVILTLFLAYLMVSGVISGTADSMAVKSLKLAMSSVIPVAGSVIADAAETVIAGAGIVRSVAGVFGIVAILATMILPFLRMGIQYLAFRVFSLMAGVAGVDELDIVLEGLGDAFAMMLALLASSGILLLMGVFVAAAGVFA